MRLVAVKLRATISGIWSILTCFLSNWKIWLFLIVLAWLIPEIYHEETILNPIKVPDDIVKLGYTDNVVADQIVDAAQKITVDEEQKIILETIHPFFKDETTLDTHVFPKEEDFWKKVVNDMQLWDTYHQVVQTDSHKIDITIPSTSFTTLAISRLIRQKLPFHPSTYINGDLVYDNNRLVLTLRATTFDKRSYSLQVFQNGKEIRPLIKDGGITLLKLINPLTTVSDAYREFIDSAKEMKDYKQLVPSLEYYLSHKPATYDALVIKMWGATLVYHEHPEEAINQIKKNIDSDSKLAYAFVAWGTALLRINKYDEAIKQFEKAKAFKPTLADAYNGSGFAFGYLGKYDEAIKQFKQTICHNPKYYSAYIGLGVAFSTLKKYDEAAEQYQKAINIEPKSVNTYIYLGQALEHRYKENENRDEAIKQYQKAINIEPKFANAYIYLGQALEHPKKYNEAAKQFKKAIDLDPKNLFAYNKYGFSIGEKGVICEGNHGKNCKKYYREAIKQLQKAIALNLKPTDNQTLANTYNYLGYSLGKLGKYDEASKQFEKATELDPMLVSAYIGWGEAIDGLKRPKEAEEKYRKAKEVSEKTKLNKAKEDQDKLRQIHNLDVERIDCN